MTRRPIPGVTRHAMERAAERIGRDLSRDEWRAVVAALVERRALVLAVDGVRVTYAVALGALHLTVVWCETDAAVVTVLPLTGRISPQTAEMGSKRIRRTFEMAEYWHGNRRRKARTVWL